MQRAGRAPWRTPARFNLESPVPCRTTSALRGRAYSAVGLAGSALHTMVVLQVFQAKLLRAMDEFGLDPASFKELRSTTDLVLLSTKTTSQAIGRSMASLVVLEVGPPSKKSSVCLTTTHSALGIGGTVPTVKAGPIPHPL